MKHFRDRQRPTDAAPGSGSGQQKDRLLDAVWPDYLRDGYFDSDGNLRPEYVSRQQVEPLAQAMARAQPALTTAQLRRFFQHCRRVESCLRGGKATWGQVRPQVLFLDAAAQDAHGKSPKKIPTIFFDFIRRNIAVIRNEKDFLEGFVPHFEALVGFGSGYIKREAS